MHQQLTQGTNHLMKNQEPIGQKTSWSKCTWQNVEGLQFAKTCIFIFRPNLKYTESQVSLNAKTLRILWSTFCFGMFFEKVLRAANLTRNNSYSFSITKPPRRLKSSTVWPDWAIFENSWWQICFQKDAKYLMTFWALLKPLQLI